MEYMFNFAYQWDIGAWWYWITIAALIVLVVVIVNLSIYAIFGTPSLFAKAGDSLIMFASVTLVVTLVTGLATWTLSGGDALEKKPLAVQGVFVYYDAVVGMLDRDDDAPACHGVDRALEDIAKVYTKWGVIPQAKVTGLSNELSKCEDEYMRKRIASETRERLARRGIVSQVEKKGQAEGKDISSPPNRVSRLEAVETLRAQISD